MFLTPNLICPYWFILARIARAIPLAADEKFGALRRLEGGEPVCQLFVETLHDKPRRSHSWNAYDYVTCLEPLIRHLVLNSALPEQVKAELRTRMAAMSSMTLLHNDIALETVQDAPYWIMKAQYQREVARLVIRLYFYLHAETYLDELSKGKSPYYTEIMMFLGALDVEGVWVKIEGQTEPVFHYQWGNQLVEIGKSGNIVGRGSHPTLERLLMENAEDIKAKVVTTPTYSRVEKDDLEIICPVNEKNDNGATLQALSLFLILHELSVYGFTVPKGYMFKA